MFRQLISPRLPSTLAMLLVGFSCAAQAQEDSKIRLDMKGCEPSALLSAYCPTGKPGCLWLADNEEKKEIYSFIPDGSELQKPTATPLAEPRIADIEALAALPRQRILIVGSASHNKSCEPRPERARFGVYDLKLKTKQTLSWPGEVFSCESAFIGNPGPSYKAFCSAIEEGRKRATTAFAAEKEQREDLCKPVETLNIEGAATDASGRTWLGLRAPLLTRPSTAGGRDAVLLRMAPIKDSGSIQVDDLRAIDLEGRGIRELSATKDWLWIVAGPALDVDVAEPFSLYRLAWSALASGSEVLKPERVRDLESSTEGFALLGDAAYTAVDGDSNSLTCPAHKHLRRLVWPN